MIAIVIRYSLYKEETDIRKPKEPSKNVNHETRQGKPHKHCIGPELKSIHLWGCTVTLFLLQNLLCFFIISGL